MYDTLRREPFALDCALPQKERPRSSREDGAVFRIASVARPEHTCPSLSTSISSVISPLGWAFSRSMAYSSMEPVGIRKRRATSPAN